MMNMNARGEEADSGEMLVSMQSRRRRGASDPGNERLYPAMAMTAERGRRLTSQDTQYLPCRHPPQEKAGGMHAPTLIPARHFAVSGRKDTRRGLIDSRGIKKAAHMGYFLVCVLSPLRESRRGCSHPTL